MDVGAFVDDRLELQGEGEVGLVLFWERAAWSVAAWAEYGAQWEPGAGHTPAATVQSYEAVGVRVGARAYAPKKAATRR